MPKDRVTNALIEQILNKVYDATERLESALSK
jgi:hypothetical protein